MLKLYKLLNYEVSRHLAKVLAICAGTLVSPLMLLNRAVDYSNYYKRFETIYESSGCIIAFAIFFAAICGVCIQSFYSNYFGSKSIYTLVTIPMKREAVYFSKLISFFIYFLMFFAAQLISVFIAHGMLSSQVARWEEGRYLMNNSLFLAFIRSGFLRILLPLGLEGIVSTVSMLAAIICSLYYAMLCERSRRFWGFAPIAAVIYILVRVITCRLNQGPLSWEYANLYIFSIILFCFCGFFIWHGTRLYKRGAIT
ncbi:MAG: ABC transporter permease subunit [Clostridiaceae bacterium]|nr:ABC transporter permease subunit [Clostridiaceae bacterium]